MKKQTFLSLLIIICFTACEDPQAAADAEAADAAAAQEAVLMEAADNYLNAWSDNNQDLMGSIITEDMVRVANGEQTSDNPEGIYDAMNYWHTAMPDFDITKVETVVNGNRAYTSWTSTGTNTGPLGDAPPTGVANSTDGFNIVTVNDEGKITKEVAYFDLLSVMTGWGYTLTHPAEAEASE